MGESLALSPMSNHTQQTTNSTEKKSILSDAIYLTDEAAAIIGVQPSTIRAYVRSGVIRGRGKPFRIRGSELFKLA